MVKRTGKREKLEMKLGDQTWIKGETRRAGWERHYRPEWVAREFSLSASRTDKT